MLKKGFIVTIDGPSGAGKSTVSKLLAEELDGKLLDTGAMYRSVAYFAQKKGIKDKKKIVQIARSLTFKIDVKNEILLVNGEDLGSRIRTEAMSQMASEISTLREVVSVPLHGSGAVGFPS
jgi:cytidylate kinase